MGGSTKLLEKLYVLIWLGFPFIWNFKKESLTQGFIWKVEPEVIDCSDQGARVIWALSWAKICFRCSLRLSVSMKLWGWRTVISGPCTRIFQEWSFQLRRKISRCFFFFFFCLVMFLSNFSKIMVYKRRVGHSQNHSALPGHSSSLPSKPSQHSPKPADTVRELPKSVVFAVIILNALNFSSGVTELCSVWPSGHSPLSK